MYCLAWGSAFSKYDTEIMCHYEAARCMSREGRHLHDVQTFPLTDVSISYLLHNPSSHRDKGSHAEATGFIGTANAFESHYAQKFITEVKLQGLHRRQSCTQKLSSDQLSIRLGAVGKNSLFCAVEPQQEGKPWFKQTTNHAPKKPTEISDPTCLSFPQI